MTLHFCQRTRLPAVGKCARPTSICCLYTDTCLVFASFSLAVLPAFACTVQFHMVPHLNSGIRSHCLRSANMAGSRSQARERFTRKTVLGLWDLSNLIIPSQFVCTGHNDTHARPHARTSEPKGRTPIEWFLVVCADTDTTAVAVGRGRPPKPANVSQPSDVSAQSVRFLHKAY